MVAPAKKVVPTKKVAAPAAAQEATTVTTQKPAPKPAAPAAKPAQAAKPAAPAAKPAPSAKPAAPAAAKPAAPAAKPQAAAPAAASDKKPAPPRVGSAKPAPKASAPAAKAGGAKGKGKITVGRKKEVAGNNFEVNVGGRTTRDALVHILFNNLKEAGLEMDSKKTVSDVLAVTETTLMDITAVSSLKFMGAMFRLRSNKARVYSVPTTENDTLVPEHNKVQYSRYADPSIVFLHGKYDAATGYFFPEGEEEGIEIGAVTVTTQDAAPEADDAGDDTAADEATDDGAEYAEEGAEEGGEEYAEEGTEEATEE